MMCGNWCKTLSVSSSDEGEPEGTHVFRGVPLLMFGSRPESLVEQWLAPSLFRRSHAAVGSQHTTQRPHPLDMGIRG